MRQTFLASRVEPPFSGKNASGSVCAHSARSCQPFPRRPLVEDGNSSLTAFASFDPEPASDALDAPADRMTLVELHACRYPEVKPDW